MSCNCNSRFDAVVASLQNITLELGQVKGKCRQIEKELFGISNAASDEKDLVAVMETTTVRQIIEKLAFDIEWVRMDREEVKKQEEQVKLKEEEIRRKEEEEVKRLAEEEEEETRRREEEIKQKEDETEAQRRMEEIQRMEETRMTVELKPMQSRLLFTQSFKTRRGSGLNRRATPRGQREFTSEVAGPPKPQALIATKAPNNPFLSSSSSSDDETIHELAPVASPGTGGAGGLAFSNAQKTDLPGPVARVPSASNSRSIDAPVPDHWSRALKIFFEKPIPSSRNDKEVGIPCPTCTYMNPKRRARCEVCEQHLLGLDRPSEK